MFTHVMVGSNDPEKSRKFYIETLGALGYEPHVHGEMTFFTDGTSGFGVGRPANGEAAHHANGGTIGFKAKTTAEVDAFHSAGLANGGTCEGKPGIRENAPGKSYGAYLRDPDGNKICAYAPNPNGAA
jgi:catechol 2,3-dioxygenase-like lactoylglutathione lyase family enzyme